MQRLVTTTDDTSEFELQTSSSSHNHAFLYSLIIPQLLEIARSPSKESLYESFTASDLKSILLINQQPHSELTTKSQFVDCVFDFLVSQQADLESVDSIDEHRDQNEQIIESLDAANTDHVVEDIAYDQPIAHVVYDKTSYRSDSQSFQTAAQQSKPHLPPIIISRYPLIDPVPTIASLRDVIVLTSCIVERDARVRVGIKVIDLTPVAPINTVIQQLMPNRPIDLTINRSNNESINQYSPGNHASVSIISEVQTTSSESDDDDSVQNTGVVRKRALSTYQKKRRTRCPDCHQGFSNEVEMFNHIAVSHGRHDCPSCRQSFRDEASLKEHLTVHSRGHPHVCKFCGKGFLKVYVLEGHEHLHTGVRPFKCDFAGCDRTFTSKLYLSKHVPVHTNTKPITQSNQHVNSDTSNKSINQPINQGKKQKISRSTKRGSQSISAYFDDQPDSTVLGNEENDLAHSTSAFFADYNEPATQSSQPKVAKPHQPRKAEIRYRPSTKYRLTAEHVDRYRTLHSILTSRLAEWDDQLFISCFNKDDLSIVAAVNRIVRAGRHISRTEQAQNVLRFVLSTTLKHPDAVIATEGPNIHSKLKQSAIATKHPAEHLMDTDWSTSDDDSDSDSSDTDSSSTLASDDSSSAALKLPTSKQSRARQKRTLTSEDIDLYRKVHPVLTSDRVVCDEKFLVSEFTVRELNAVALSNQIARVIGHRKSIQARYIFEFLQSKKFIHPDKLVIADEHQSDANTFLWKDVGSEQSMLLTDHELAQSDDDDFFQHQSTFKKRKRSMSGSDEESKDSDDSSTTPSKRSKSPLNDYQATDFESQSVELADYRDIYAKILALDWHFLTPELLNSILNESECRIVMNVHQLEHHSLSKDQLINQIFRLLDENGLQM